LIVGFPVVRALAERALALDEGWSKGAIHELMISLDSLPEALGGDPKRARQHFDHAVALQKGQVPGPYIALAVGVSVPEGNRGEFEKLLKQALDMDPNADPSARLATLITQRRARALLDQIDNRFVQ
jgi:predicted anti-sigma-YlaC factor YlaD